MSSDAPGECVDHSDLNAAERISAVEGIRYPADIKKTFSRTYAGTGTVRHAWPRFPVPLPASTLPAMMVREANQ